MIYMILVNQENIKVINISTKIYFAIIFKDVYQNYFYKLLKNFFLGLCYSFKLNNDERDIL